MEFDRNTVKGAISSKGQADDELSEKFSTAHKAQVELEKLRNNHELSKITKEQGWLGRIFGSWKNVPMLIALLSVISGFLAFVVITVIAGSEEGADRELLSKSAHMSLSFASAALAYIFGRGSNT